MHQIVRRNRAGETKMVFMDPILSDQALRQTQAARAFIGFVERCGERSFCPGEATELRSQLDAFREGVPDGAPRQRVDGLIEFVRQVLEEDDCIAFEQRP